MPQQNRCRPLNSIMAGGPPAANLPSCSGPAAEAIGILADWHTRATCCVDPPASIDCHKGYLIPNNTGGSCPDLGAACKFQGHADFEPVDPSGSGGWALEEIVVWPSETPSDPLDGCTKAYRCRVQPPPTPSPSPPTPPPGQQCFPADWVASGDWLADVKKAFTFENLYVSKDRCFSANGCVVKGVSTHTCYNSQGKCNLYRVGEGVGDCAPAADAS